MIKKQKNAEAKKELDTVLDGLLVKKLKNSFYLIPKSKEKQTKFFLVPETIFVELKLSMPDKIISEKKVKWADIKEENELSLVIDKDNKKKNIALIIRQIRVID